jgi:hypothetical protein
MAMQHGIDWTTPERKIQACRGVKLWSMVRPRRSHTQSSPVLQYIEAPAQVCDVVVGCFQGAIVRANAGREVVI